jgi:superfamily II DNA or RNA helicase
VLGAIDLHIADNKLHIVAAPGSGKTTLGLEVFRQLGKPTLVLSPTRTIRDQWIKRLRDFVPSDAPFPLDWVSSDLRAPAFFTSITYQALHTKYRGDGDDTLELSEEPSIEEEADAIDKTPSSAELKLLIAELKKIDIGTLILDEAHHLRSEWWKALTAVLAALPDVKLVSLTATPPYDVTGQEWQRYQDLCGAIDEEVSVPELVQVGTLCPHQDYVFAVSPLKIDTDTLKAYDESVSRICNELLDDDVLLAIIRRHPWITNTTASPQEILDNPELAIALLAYLKTRGEALPKYLVKLMDTRPVDLPIMTRRWWHILVRSYLFDSVWESLTETTEHRDQLASRLRTEGLLFRRELRINDSRPIRVQLSLSGAKVQACIDVYRFERKVRGDGLRQVILTDFIRDEGVDAAGSGIIQLGSFPVFRAMVDAIPQHENLRVGLLTGRVAILHEDRIPELQQHLGDQSVSTTPLPNMPNFVKVNLSGGGRLTRAFTELLTAGDLQVLVGTRALLGEGWDAPTINSLIIASFVGSFMLSNQMRGRAIRVDPNQPDKAASIWHLVAVESSTPTGLSDIEDMARRFRSFTGLAAKKPFIQSGLGRLALREKWSKSDIQGNNMEMQRRLDAIDQLKKRWAEAIEMGSEGRVLPSVLTEKPPSMRPFHFSNTLRYLLLESLFMFLLIVGYNLQGSQYVRDLESLLYTILFAVGIALIITLPKLAKAGWLLFRHLPIDGSIRQIGLALRDALYKSELVATDPRRLNIITQKLDDGSVSIALGGGTFYEESLFADGMNELLGQIDNPRYLLMRSGKLIGIERHDYHAVPTVLGINKDRAMALQVAWNKWVGPSELLYTRGDNGRTILLHARARAFSTAIEKQPNRLDQWQ